MPTAPHRHAHQPLRPNGCFISKRAAFHANSHPGDCAHWLQPRWLVRADAARRCQTAHSGRSGTGHPVAVVRLPPKGCRVHQPPLRNRATHGRVPHLDGADVHGADGSDGGFQRRRHRFAVALRAVAVQEGQVWRVRAGLAALCGVAQQANRRVSDCTEGSVEVARCTANHAHRTNNTEQTKTTEQNGIKQRATSSRSSSNKSSSCCSSSSSSSIGVVVGVVGVVVVAAAAA